MKKLEAYKAFPIIAWFVIIGFAYFVYTLTNDLDDEATLISEQTLQTQAAIAGQVTN